MDTAPNKNANFEIVKLMLESRYKEAAIHVRSYSTMLAMNLAVFAAGFGYLSGSESAVGWTIRVFMVAFGLFIAFSWWASSYTNGERRRTLEGRGGESHQAGSDTPRSIPEGGFRAVLY